MGRIYEAGSIIYVETKIPLGTRVFKMKKASRVLVLSDKKYMLYLCSTVLMQGLTNGVDKRVQKQTNRHTENKICN